MISNNAMKKFKWHLIHFNLLSPNVSLSELWEMVMDREPGVLRFMGLQRVRHDWATELKGTAYFCQK